jgi:radical SAM protein with 4Fe4S-binding SPASM domain
MINTKILKWFIKKGFGLEYEPIFAKIEITRRCNLDCIMCVRKKLGKVPKDMTLEEFKYIIDNLPTVTVISPHGYGEPLIHPDFLQMMSYAREKGKDIGLVTNGTLFTKKLIKGFLNLKPKDVMFSFDSPYKKEYEKIRKGAKFEKTLQNLKDMIKMKKNISPKTRVSITMTVNVDNMKSIPDMIRLCDKIGIDGISITDITWMYNVGTSTKDKAIREGENTKKILNSIPKTKRTKVNLCLGNNTERKCPLPWTSTYIDVEGNVFPCTDNLECFPGKWKLGNIFKKSIKEIYNSEKMKDFRYKSTHGLNENCLKCIEWAKGEYPFYKRLYWIFR